MDFITGIFVFLIVWWTALFTILPLWVRRHDGQVEGADPGAPQHPYLWRKVLTTTLLSAVIWLIIYGLIEMEIISFYAIADLMFSRDQGL
ncbi:MAG: DUF1467 family protein [Pseudomonadota bacterium]